MLGMVLGVTAALAFKPAEAKIAKTDTIYFSVADNADGSQFHWVTAQPTGRSCQSGEATCKISTSLTPVSNQLPASYTALQGADGDSVYR